MATRSEHLQNIKAAANALVDANDLDGAVSTMMAGLRAHAETVLPAPMENAVLLEISNYETRTADKVRAWIANFT